MKLEFKPEDFADFGTKEEGTCLAEIANARLAEMLKDSPVVYDNDSTFTTCSTDKRLGDTHRARLVEIEEISKKEKE